jgi:D-alanyl-D-alanine carboxypeptidase/D-alanyl-D-alanine-endopeptidase (penicillin-binding protein 4)
MKQFAQALRRKGIKKIDGRLIIDLFLKEPVKSEAHWYPWDLSFSKYGVIYKGPERVKHALKGAIRAAGIQLKDDQVVFARVPKGSHCIYRYCSGINKVIRRMWKNSSNTKATSLLYTIGKRVNPKVNPTEAGVLYLRNFLHKEIGVTDSTLVVHDGCGLCTHNHLSAEALVKILDYGYRDKAIFNYLWNYLAISGVDGTLARFGYELRGKVHAKTGTLSHPYGISSLAGYCKAQNGHLLAFAIMDSEMSVLDAHVLQRKLCKILVK